MEDDHKHDTTTTTFKTVINKIYYAYQSTMGKLDPYNKNHLFEKIILGIFVLLELTYLYCFWNLFQMRQASSTANSVFTFTDVTSAFTKGVGAINGLSNGYLFIRFLLLLVLLSSLYLTYRSNKDQGVNASLTRIMLWLTFILTTLGNIFARRAIEALSAATSALRGNFDSLFGLAGTSLEELLPGMRMLVVFYILAAMAAGGAIWFLYRDVWGKKQTTTVA